MSLFMTPISVYSKDLYLHVSFNLQAVQLLRPGGILVYSTCTITMEENEKQVVWMLENFPELILTPQVSSLSISLLFIIWKLKAKDYS